jgi:uncharacterized protein (TIGR02217 family)
MFDEVRLNLGYDYGAIGGPSFNPLILEDGSGRRVRHAQRYQSKGRWNVGNRQISEANLNSLKDFFIARNGRQRGFRWKDWTDYQANLHFQHLSGYSSEGQWRFQLVKQYGSRYFGSSLAASFIFGSYQRPIYKPVQGTVHLFAVIGSINPVELTEGTQWTLNYQTGEGFIDPPFYPGSNIWYAATFEFDVPVRFDRDDFAANYLGGDIWQLSNLAIVEETFSPPASTFWYFPHPVTNADNPEACPWGFRPYYNHPSGGDIGRCGVDRPSRSANLTNSFQNVFEVGYVPDSLHSLVFETQIDQSIAGFERRDSRYDVGIRFIDIGNRRLNSTELDVFLALFYGSRGGAAKISFRFKNELLQGYFPPEINVSFVSSDTTGTNIYQLHGCLIEVD